jgi:hypothetical protein
MIDKVNKYGWPRDIPDDIKRFVRQKDGFGCVHCGRGIYQYDHFDPEFRSDQSSSRRDNFAMHSLSREENERFAFSRDHKERPSQSAMQTKRIFLRGF